MPAARPLRALAGALFLAGCTQLPSAWDRVDGAPIANTQLQADTLACKGDVERAAVQGQA